MSYNQLQGRQLLAQILHILFLDFDGVLHPFQRGTFDRIALLEDWLERNPSVGVVISSTWRYQYSLEDLKEFFKSSVRHQIIGVTPTLAKNEGLIVVAPSRTEELLAWLRANPQFRSWLALDDEPGLFTDHSNIVFTLSSEALKAEHLETLSKRFGLT